MIDFATLPIFLAAALALNMTPGSDMMFCMGQGVKGGQRLGLAASFGIATGSLIHTGLAAFGLAALLKTNPLAFELIRWMGVAYLTYLGVQAFRFRKVLTDSGVSHSPSAMAAWRAGTIVNLLNPKVIFFILAFLPQFVDPERGSSVAQFLVLGLLFNVTGTIVNGLVGFFAGVSADLLKTKPAVSNLLNAISGLVFFALAAKLALTDEA